jgi:hypothetical protein
MPNSGPVTSQPTSLAGKSRLEGRKAVFTVVLPFVCTQFMIIVIFSQEIILSVLLLLL